MDQVLKQQVQFISIRYPSIHCFTSSDSILFHSILFYSILSYSNLSYPVLFTSYYPMLYHTVVVNLNCGDPYGPQFDSPNATGSAGALGGNGGGLFTIS